MRVLALVSFSTWIEVKDQEDADLRVGEFEANLRDGLPPEARGVYIEIGEAEETDDEQE